jgi:hypothetical protein
VDESDKNKFYFPLQKSKVQISNEVIESRKNKFVGLEWKLPKVFNVNTISIRASYAPGVKESTMFGPNNDLLPHLFPVIYSKEEISAKLKTMDPNELFCVDPYRMSYDQRVQTASYYLSLIKNGMSSMANSFYNDIKIYKNLVVVMKHFGKSHRIICTNELDSMNFNDPENAICFHANITLVPWHYTTILYEICKNLDFIPNTLQAHMNFMNMVFETFIETMGEKLRSWMQDNLSLDTVGVITIFLLIALQSTNPKIKVFFSSLQPSFFDFLNRINNISPKHFIQIYKELMLEDIPAGNTVDQIQYFSFDEEPTKEFLDAFGYFIKSRGRSVRLDNLKYSTTNILIESISYIVQAALGKQTKEIFFVLEQYMRIIKKIFVYKGKDLYEICFRALATVSILLVQINKKPREVYNSITSLCVSKCFMEFFNDEKDAFDVFISSPYPDCFWRFMFYLFRADRLGFVLLMNDPALIDKIIKMSSINDILAQSHLIKYLCKIIDLKYNENISTEPSLFKRGQPAVEIIISIILQSNIDFSMILRQFNTLENRSKLGNNINIFYVFKNILNTRPSIRKLLIKENKLNKMSKSFVLGKA